MKSITYTNYVFYVNDKDISTFDSNRQFFPTTTPAASPPTAPIP